MPHKLTKSDNNETSPSLLHLLVNNLGISLSYLFVASFQHINKKSDKLKICMPHKLTNHYLKVTTMKLLQACYIYWSMTWASL